jgi:uncharacterized protein (TIGR03067 family)
MTRILRMTAVLAVLLVMVQTLVLAEDDKATKPANDKEQLQGVWKVQALKANGKSSTTDIGKTLTFDGDKLLPQGLEDAQITLKLNPDKNPREFDLFMEGKPLLKGIYKLDGDTLLACFPDNIENGQERPKAFTAVQGSKQVQLTAKKIKGKE